MYSTTHCPCARDKPSSASSASIFNGGPCLPTRCPCVSPPRVEDVLVLVCSVGGSRHEGEAVPRYSVESVHQYINRCVRTVYYTTILLCLLSWNLWIDRQYIQPIRVSSPKTPRLGVFFHCERWPSFSCGQSLTQILLCILPSGGILRFNSSLAHSTRLLLSLLLSKPPQLIPGRPPW